MARMHAAAGTARSHGKSFLQHPEILGGCEFGLGFRV